VSFVIVAVLVTLVFLALLISAVVFIGRRRSGGEMITGDRNREVDYDRPYPGLGIFGQGGPNSKR
jgi:hypothetical protein